MIVAEIDGLGCGRRISTAYQASMPEGPPVRLSLHDCLGRGGKHSHDAAWSRLGMRKGCSELASLVGVIQLPPGLFGSAVREKFDDTAAPESTAATHQASGPVRRRSSPG